jgi:peptidoglycan hydrolase-like protein with peptidoglycan-binding domain
MQGRRERQMGQQLLLLVVGFVLTSVLGGLLGYLLQSRAWAHQHDVQRRDEERQQALKTFEEISLLLDRRLYRMRRLYWAARRKAQGTGDEAGLTSAQDDYREVLAEWNDNLNRTLALVETYFGSQTRTMLEDEVYDEFADTGRGLEEIVRMVLAAGGERIEIPRFGYRVTSLSHRVYELNVRMLRLLEDESIGRSTPRVSPTAVSLTTGKPRLEIGNQGRDVRRLQRALRRAGQDVDVDGLFRQKTWEAVCSLQRSRGLNVDGIAGPGTWAELPSGAPMPILRSGSRGDAVAQLQRVLADHAQGRWQTSPQAATGTFDASTSATVKAFQQWNSIASDGIVGDQTWAAPAGRSSLEAAVGLAFVSDDKPHSS